MKRKREGESKKEYYQNSNTDNENDVVSPKRVKTAPTKRTIEDFRADFISIFECWEFEKILSDLGIEESFGKDMLSFNFVKCSSEILKLLWEDVASTVFQNLPELNRASLYSSILKQLYRYVRNDNRVFKQKTVIKGMVHYFFFSKFPPDFPVCLFDKRSEEGNVLKEFKPWEDLAVIEMCGIDVPLDAFFEILSYLKKNYGLITTVGLVNESFFAAVLHSWDTVSLRKKDVYKISLVVLASVHEIRVMAGIPSKDWVYIFSKINPKRIRVIDMNSAKGMNNQIYLGLYKKIDQKIQLPNVTKIVFPLRFFTYDETNRNTFSCKKSVSWNHITKFKGKFDICLFPNVRVALNCRCEDLMYLNLQRLEKMSIVFSELMGKDEFKRFVNRGKLNFTKLKELELDILEHKHKNRMCNSYQKYIKNRPYPKNHAFNMFFEDCPVLENLKIHFSGARRKYCQMRKFRIELDFSKLPKMQELFIDFFKLRDGVSINEIKVPPNSLRTLTISLPSRFLLQTESVLRRLLKIECKELLFDVFRTSPNYFYYRDPWNVNREFDWHEILDLLTEFFSLSSFEVERHGKIDLLFFLDHGEESIFRLLLDPIGLWLDPTSSYKLNKGTLVIEFHEYCPDFVLSSIVRLLNNQVLLVNSFSSRVEIRITKDFEVESCSRELKRIHNRRFETMSNIQEKIPGLNKELYYCFVVTRNLSI